MIELVYYSFFFFNDTATTEIYTLSLHDALPISRATEHQAPRHTGRYRQPCCVPRLRLVLLHNGPDHRHRRWLDDALRQDRKSTRLNSSHANISYAVFCLKKKKP